MTQYSLARYRRSQQPQEPSLRLITFQVRQQWFCLPLVMARRVMTRATNGQSPILGLTQLQRDNIPLVDIAPLVYEEAPLLSGAETTDGPGQSQDRLYSAILVIAPPSLEPIGLMIDGIPVLKRVKQSAFSPVPAVYLRMNRLQGIHTLINQGENEPPLFLLEIDSLLTKLMGA